MPCAGAGWATAAEAAGCVSVPQGMTEARLGVQEPILARACAAEGTAGSLAFQAAAEGVLGMLGPQRARLGAAVAVAGDAGTGTAESGSATDPEPQCEKDVMRMRAPVGPLLPAPPLLFRRRQQQTAHAGTGLTGLLWQTCSLRAVACCTRAQWGCTDRALL